MYFSRYISARCLRAIVDNKIWLTSNNIRRSIVILLLSPLSSCIYIALTLLIKSERSPDLLKEKGFKITQRDNCYKSSVLKLY